MKAFLINLDRSPDRLAFMQEQFNRLGLKPERIAGIDGNNVELPDPGVVDEKAFRRRHHAPLRRGEVGCYLSHVAALRAFLAAQEPHGLILEDDAELSVELPGVLTALAAAADKWDLVKLHATHPGGIITRQQITVCHRLVSLAFRLPPMSSIGGRPRGSSPVSCR